MDFDIGVRLGMLLIGAIGCWKLIVEFWRGRYNHLREEYRFARDFFDDLARTPDMHPFVKQKGYQAIVGDTGSSADEIEYLLTFHDAAKAMRSYRLAKTHLEFRITSARTKLEFKPGLQKRWARFWRKLLYAGLYFILYVLGALPLILPSFHLLSIKLVPLAFLFSATFFFPLGFFALTAGLRIVRAEELVKDQYAPASTNIHIAEPVVKKKAGIRQ